MGDVIKIVRGRYWDELSVGATFTTSARTLTEADLVNFVGNAGFMEPLFTDRVYAKERSAFGAAIVPAAMTWCFAEGLVILSGLLHGTAVAFLKASLDVKKPVFVGDTIHVELEIIESRATRSGSRGIVVTRNRVTNQSGEVVMDYEPTRLIKSSPTGADAAAH
jgi:acyl dehydratase